MNLTMPPGHSDKHPIALKNHEILVACAAVSVRGFVIPLPCTGQAAVSASAEAHDDLFVQVAWDLDEVRTPQPGPPPS